LREVLEGYARSAFGAGSWSQREHEKGLLALYETAGEAGRGIKEQEWSLVRQEFMGQAEEWNVQKKSVGG
jgi:hypothetical protein